MAGDVIPVTVPKFGISTVADISNGQKKKQTVWRPWQARDNEGMQIKVGNSCGVDAAGISGTELTGGCPCHN